MLLSTLVFIFICSGTGNGNAGLIGLAFLFNLFHVKYCVNEWA